MADDDVNFLSFLKKKTPQPSEKPAAQEITSEESLSLAKADSGIDFKKAWSWTKTNWRPLLVAFLLLTTIYIGWSIRAQPSTVPLADDWATNNVLGFIRNDISAAYQAQYPNLPQQNRDKLVADEYAKALNQPSYTVKTGDYRGQTFVIGQQIQQDSAGFRSFFQYEANGRSFTYMPDIDPYTWLRYARNYIDTGDIADERRNGAPFDNHMVAPIGAPIENNAMPYLIAWLYKFTSVFNSKITLMQSAGYLSLVIIALSVFPVFFIGKRVAGMAAGFFASLVFVTNNALLGRTIWGHADTDGFNVFFPLMIVWCFLESYYAKSWLKRALLLVTGGILTGLFAYLWAGWWYVFDFVLAVAGSYFAYLVWIHKKEMFGMLKNKEIQHHVIGTLLFILVSGIMVTSILSFKTFTDAPLQPIEFMSLKDAAKISLFPNVLTTVAELNAASLGQVVGQMGGIRGFPFIYLAVLGLILLAIPHGTRSWKDIIFATAGFVWYFILIGAVERLLPTTFMVLFTIPVVVLIVREALRQSKTRAETFDIKLILFLLIWFLATMYASTQGIRFVMLLVPAFSIAFGAGIGLLADALGRAGKLISVNSKIVTGVIIAIFALMMIGPTQNAYAAGRSDVPIINDAWYNTLNKIKEESAPNAIITSWWDFGHHFKYYADRAVTFDGASQNEPMAHWVGKILLLNDEKQAIGILRMLHCGSSTGFDVLNAEVNDISTSVQYLNDMFKLDEKQARAYLAKKSISQATIDKLMPLTHCNPPEAYFIASGDMIGKSGVWAHFGSWDFNRADAWIFARSMSFEDGVQFIMNNSGLSREAAEARYNEVKSITNEQDGNSWIAPWPSYNGDLFGCGRNGNMLDCANDIHVDLTTMDVTLPAQNGETRPAIFAYATKNGVVEKKYNSTSQFSLTLVPQGDNYGILLAHKDLASSMFTRMYYLQGHGLRYFKPYNVQRDSSGLLIYTYKVDWTGNNMTTTAKDIVLTANAETNTTA